MAQHCEFYKIHGERGLKFYNELVATGFILTSNPKHLGFPIHQIHNKQLLTMFKQYKASLQLFKQGAIAHDDYMAIKRGYSKELSKYHNVKL